jgi:hypothetical protein
MRTTIREPSMLVSDVHRQSSPDDDDALRCAQGHTYTVTGLALATNVAEERRRAARVGTT